MPIFKARPFSEYSRCLEIVKFNYTEISRRYDEIKNHLDINHIKQKDLTGLKTLSKALLRCNSFLIKSYNNVEHMYEYYSPEEKVVIDEYHDLEKNLIKLTNDIDAYHKTMQDSLSSETSLDI